VDAVVGIEGAAGPRKAVPVHMPQGRTHSIHYVFRRPRRAHRLFAERRDR
jgi:hypothetical protein